MNLSMQYLMIFRPVHHIEIIVALQETEDSRQHATYVLDTISRFVLQSRETSVTMNGLEHKWQVLRTNS